MKMPIVFQLLFSAILVGALAACTPIQAPTPAANATSASTSEATPTSAAQTTGEPFSAEATTSPDRVTVEPLPSAECEAIRAEIAQQLNVELTMQEADFTSEIANRQGRSCTLTATGTGEDFGNFVDTAQKIRDILVTDGWTENQSYIADSPSATDSGFEKENKLALMQVGWKPSEDVDCPTDQPISACDIEPSQQLFTVVIELVQTS
jgi:hypothetical protein